MKILLDENTARDFVDLLAEHEVVTVQELGWDGVKNGVLLDSASEAGFGVLLTVDKQMPHQ